MLLNHVKFETESESVINNPRNESIGIVSMGEDTCLITGQRDLLKIMLGCFIISVRYGRLVMNALMLRQNEKQI